MKSGSDSDVRTAHTGKIQRQGYSQHKEFYHGNDAVVEDFQRSRCDRKITKEEVTHSHLSSDVTRTGFIGPARVTGVPETDFCYLASGNFKTF